MVIFLVPPLHSHRPQRSPGPGTSVKQSSGGAHSAFHFNPGGTHCLYLACGAFHFNQGGESYLHQAHSTFHFNQGGYLCLHCLHGTFHFNPEGTHCLYVARGAFHFNREDPSAYGRSVRIPHRTIDPSAHGRTIDPSVLGRSGHILYRTIDPSAYGRTIDPSAHGRTVDPSAHGRTIDPSACADDFDANGNFISTSRFLDPLARGEDTPPGEGGRHIPLINNIDWNDPSLYTMPLTHDEIAALTHDIVATNHPLPELPPPTHVAGASTSPARTPSPKPSEIHDQGPVSPTQSEVSDTSREVPELLQREANTSTWAARNPTRATIHPRTPPPQLTDAQKASCKIKRDQTMEKRKRLHNAVAEYLEEQRVKIEALSRAHSVTPKVINDIIGGRTHYRNSRKMQVKNALVHAKSKEMNADLPVGSQYSLAELHEMVASDPKMKDLTREQHQRMSKNPGPHLST
ncbi:hypothetical protein C8R48DRAFT_679071 [Suillus tomentosus]|nr:hypothetical protein C8R48DRAFT_679071 [Suillus tomentosus]